MPLAILVLSCDKYAALWDLYFDRQERFWPDCPYPVYLLANALEYRREGVYTLRTVEDIDWTSNLLFALDRIEAESVLLMLEDAPLDGPVDQLEFAALLAAFQQWQMHFLNLKADPRPPRGGGRFVEIPPGAHYRVAAVPNLWRVDTLRQLTVVGESAWQFEVRGSVRSDRFGGFWALRMPFFRILHCVIQGKLDLRAARVLETTGEAASLHFPVMSRGQFVRLRVREMLSVLLRLLTPYGLRRSLRNFYYRHVVKTGNLI